MSIEMGTAASITTNPIRRLAIALALGACGTMTAMMGGGAPAAASGDWTVVTRDDGSRQWALRGQPLHDCSKDTKPGDRTGDGFSNVWRIAKP